jgi:PAS domain S-box-containing protein
MKILIVEDDTNSRVFLERALLSQGYAVESAASGVQALEKANLSPPDLIISDIMMPEMDGFELCRRVKTDERLHTVPFVFYTATYIDQKDEKLAMALGASRFLIKPMEPEKFFSAISEVIEEYRARHLPVPDHLLSEMPELDRMQVEALARKLDKKVRELEKEREELLTNKLLLRHTQQDWEDIFQAIGHPTIILDAQHNILSVNKATVKAARANSEEELIGKKCYEIFHNACEPPKGCPLVKMLASAKLEESEMEVEAFGGIYLVSCTPVFDEKGNLQKIIHIATDITERKIAEEALRKEKTFSDIMINSLPGIFYLFDENGHFLRWNRNFEIVSGYSSEEIEKMNPLDLFSGDEKKLLGEAIQEVFVKGESKVEANFISKDGRRTPYYFTGLRFMSDNRSYLIGMGIDITGRMMAEEALRESERRFRKLFEESNISIIIHDKNSGEIIDANVLAIKSYGFSTLEELRNNEFWIEPPYSLKEALEWIHKTDREGSQHFEWLSRRITGEIFWEDVRLSKITINGIERILSTTVNITERKQAEEAIRKLNNELEQRIRERTVQLEEANRELESEIAERIQKEERIKRQNVLLEGINWIVREALTVETEEELSSQSLAIAEELTGSRFGFIDELNEAGTMDSMTLSNPGWEVCRMPHTEAAILLKNIPVRGIYADTIRKGISVIVNDPASHPDRVGVPEGHPRITAFLGVPLKQGDKVIGLIGLANKESGYDTDDQQAIEMLSVAFVEALNRIRSENLVNTLNKELQQSIAEVSHANKELEAFSYSVSHDLRAPLRAIDGFAEILLKEYSPKLDDEGKRICSIITGNSKKMGQLIDELLALSRLGRAEMRFSSIDMKALTDSVYDELTTPEMRQRIEFHIGDLCNVPGDPTLIRQAWMNLISNAIKFSSHREQALISIKCRKEEDRVVYCVQDNGAGFNMQYAGKLFKVFQRLHSEKEFEGTGVGLAIVQRVVNRHGGEVWAEGEVDKGAMFCFSIPRKEGNRQ